MLKHLASVIRLLGQEELIYKETEELKSILNNPEIISDLVNVVGQAIEEDNKKIQPRYKQLAAKVIGNYLVRHPDYQDYNHTALSYAMANLVDTTLYYLFTANAVE